MVTAKEARVRVKRAYDAPEADDGYRVLVDRLWPRGVAKEALRLDAWLKEIAPSPDLRKWFGHEPERWERFRQLYRQELETPAQRRLLGELAERAKRDGLTLVYGARDRDHNGALVLREIIMESLAGKAA